MLNKKIIEEIDDGIIGRNVTVVYRNGTIGLRNANFEIPSGSISALVGVNGAGKSTLFKAIMGFVPASSGSILLFGASVKKALQKNIVAYVPQSEDVDWTFPVLVDDVVMMGRYGKMNWLRIPSTEDKQAVSNALSRVGLLDCRKRQIGELSGGQRKRVFLARALAQNTKIILLDEPFAGVDVQTEEEIIKLLIDIKAEGRLILVATHNLGSVPQFCDYTVLVKETVLAHGPTKSTFTPENLKLAFGGVLRHFVLSGSDLHDDKDSRQVTVISDDERPLVLYSEDDN